MLVPLDLLLKLFQSTFSILAMDYIDILSFHFLVSYQMSSPLNWSIVNGDGVNIASVPRGSSFENA